MNVNTSANRKMEHNIRLRENLLPNMLREAPVSNPAAQTANRNDGKHVVLFGASNVTVLTPSTSLLWLGGANPAGREPGGAKDEVPGLK